VLFNTAKTLNIYKILNRLNVLGVAVLKNPKKTVKKRNIVLRIETYKKLEQYKVDLVKEKGNPNITFDNAIMSLLEEHYKK
jgi:hypothetical protein